MITYPRPWLGAWLYPSDATALGYAHNGPLLDQLGPHFGGIAYGPRDYLGSHPIVAYAPAGPLAPVTMLGAATWAIVGRDEPNKSGPSGAVIPVADYYALLAPRAEQAVQHGLVPFAGGLAGLDLAYLRSLLRLDLQRLGGPLLQGIMLNLIDFRMLPLFPDAFTLLSRHLAAIIATVEGLRHPVRRLLITGGAVPLGGLWEGIRTCVLVAQAKAIQQAQLRFSGWHLGLAYWCLRSYCTQQRGDCDHGLFRENGKPRPVVAALRSLIGEGGDDGHPSVFQ